ncbi:MAG: cobalt-precorrin-5B (C(1))-methyltransferase [Chromatiaceae bacterium]|nr:cobalt-precorrin-5B (C(1))-methyltransferase [Chromatiaceae bacterium]MBP8283657.1 cobalt-precorrin-5B (C(1))-methyltransferase [Chromatiaceae bacterium]MBP8288852.1 cobalt-precorrin-5B (C(1))-methyltransferase [Chromatiaceae bacterium]
MIAPEKRRRGLRTGFTTGACAAAAARAAAVGLISGRVPDQIDCLLPNGQWASFAVSDGRLEEGSAHAMVVKDAGDDPDCTNGAHLTADVRPLPRAPGEVRIQGGLGIGTVTLPGLGLEVGGPAINPVPRRNIEENVRAAAGHWLAEQGLEVTISVPGGEKMALKTLNPRLGILGGISILGTSGIVRPYSTASFRASVVQGIEVAAAQGQDTLVLTTGGRTEKFVMRTLPHLAPACFVQMGDFTGAALDTVVRQGIHQVVIGCMVGKLAKMAQGETLTHARRAEVDRDLLAELARECGAPAEVCEAIRQAETARYAAERLAELGLGQAFHQALAQRLVRTLAERYPGQFSLQVLVCDFEGDKLIAEAASAPAAHADEQGGTRRPHRLGSVAQPTDSPAPSPLAGEGWGEGSEGLHIDV